jgi:siroheme synthase (precorrin-2 oxidase/ferrochelatase)
VLRRGDLLVAVASGGRAPAMAAAIRDRLAGVLGPEWALAVEIAARLRTESLTVSGKTAYSQKVFVEMLEAGLTELLARGDAAAVNHLLTRVCGRETTLAGLGLTLPDRMP